MKRISATVLILTVLSTPSFSAEFLIEETDSQIIVEYTGDPGSAPEVAPPVSAAVQPADEEDDSYVPSERSQKKAAAAAERLNARLAKTVAKAAKP